MADRPYMRTRLLIKVLQSHGMNAWNDKEVTRGDGSYVHDYHHAVVRVGNARFSLAAKNRAEYAVRSAKISHGQHSDSERHPTANAFGLNKIRHVRVTHL
ncbi:hypothetical protein GCM10018953_14210 [Streptosporangium nondiastaticum]